MSHRLFCLHVNSTDPITDTGWKDSYAIPTVVKDPGRMQNDLMNDGLLGFPLWVFWLYDEPQGYAAAKKCLTGCINDVLEMMDPIVRRANPGVRAKDLVVKIDSGKHKTQSMRILISLPSRKKW